MKFADLAALRRELREYVNMKLAGVFSFTRSANTTALGGEDAIETGDDDENKGQRPVRRIEPWGLRGRPVAKQRTLALKLGSSTVLYLGVASDGGYGPGDLEDGEVALYSKNVERGVHLKDSGDVALESASGQLVTANGDDYAALKTDDFITALKTFVTTLKTVANVNQINVAATTFDGTFAPAGDFKSTKFKHG